MNGPAEKSTTRGRASIHNQLAHLTQRELSCFFFDMDGVIPTATGSDMYTLEFPSI